MWDFCVFWVTEGPKLSSEFFKRVGESFFFFKDVALGEEYHTKMIMQNFRARLSGFTSLRRLLAV